jgi:uncharacterized protein (TIGR01777 family)
MNLGVTGATGLIGRSIVHHALRRGHEVVAFSRNPGRSIPGCTMRNFALDVPPDIHGCEAIIHLAGEPIIGLWTPAKKRRIVRSREIGTRRVVEAINAQREPPEVFVCGSAIGIYAAGGEIELTEEAPHGDGFLAATVATWEAAALCAQRTRVVMLRTAVVLAKEGGALASLLPLFRIGLGAQVADGRQWMSWIHIDDEARLALFAVENLEVNGPLNASAPWPVRNADFTVALAQVLRRPAFLRLPRFVLRALGDLSGEFLDSKRVVPAAAAEHGFPFHFAHLDGALKDLLG